MKRAVMSKQAPAIAIAVLALVAAVSGVAVAVPNALKSKVTVSKVRKIADSEIAAKTPGLAKSAADSQITARAPGLTVANASQLGGVAAGGYQRSVRAAVIQVNPSTFTASVVRGNATGAGRLANGKFYVDFPADIRECVPVANMTDTEPGYATATRYSGSDPNAIEVDTFAYNSIGSSDDPPDGYTFNVVVIC